MSWYEQQQKEANSEKRVKSHNETSGWIKTEDELPKVRQDFLGWCDGDIDHYFRESKYQVLNRNSRNYASADVFKVVTHWMPLPPPPSTETGERND